MGNGLEITHEYSPVENLQERLGLVTLGDKVKILKYKRSNKIFFLKLEQPIVVKLIKAFSRLFKVLKTPQDTSKLPKECTILEFKKTKRSNKL